VYLCLCDHADDKTGLCWPSVSTLAEECELTERAVRKCLRALELLSLICTEQRGNLHLVSRYKIVNQGGTVFPLTRNGIPPKGEPYSAKGEQRSAQASRSPIESPKGNGAPKLASLIPAQIKATEARIEKIKMRFPFSDADKAELKTMVARRNQLENELIHAT